MAIGERTVMEKLESNLLAVLDKVLDGAIVAVRPDNKSQKRNIKYWIAQVQYVIFENSLKVKLLF